MHMSTFSEYHLAMSYIEGQELLNNISASSHAHLKQDAQRRMLSSIKSQMRVVDDNRKAEDTEALARALVGVLS